MTKLPYILRKELLVLLRDRIGLAFIFIMPLAVLIVVTMVQDGALKSVSKFQIKAALVDEDDSEVSRSLATALAQADGMQLITETHGRPLNRTEASELIRRKQVQVFIVFPKDLGRQAAAAAKNWAEGKESQRAPAIETYFDPGISGGYQAIVHIALQNLAQGKEFELGMREWASAMPRKLADLMPEGTILPRPQGKVPLPEFRAGHAISVAQPANATITPQAGDSQAARLPSMSQFNVPAYAVFAMFFIVIPISSCLLRERNESTLTRLLTMQVRPDEMIAGKLLTYLGISLVQFCMMLAAGLWLLPLLGTAPFILNADPFALFALTMTTSLAAVGFALALASTATSTEQSAMIGSTSVVMFAALGGVMVPVFFMPPVMQQISSFTPLNWAVTAYQDLFTRGATIGDIATRMLLLASFGSVGVAWSWHRLFQRE
jgi:ABC-2 type transport system permease protein